MLEEQKKTKKRSKQRDWCFTLNGTIPPVYNPEVVQYLCFQEENAPTTGQHHFQGFLILKQPQGMTYVKNNFNKEAHLEPRKGTREQAINYCKKKDGTQVDGTFKEFGVLTEMGKDAQLSDVEYKLKLGASIEKIVKENTSTFIKYSSGIMKCKLWLDKAESRKFRKVECLVYYGQTGAGKTRGAIEYCCLKNIDYYILDPPINDTLWFDGYDGEKVLIIDEFYGQISQKTLLRILDGYPFKCPIKGGFAWAKWELVIFTSNKAPSDWYKLGLTEAFKRRCPPDNWTMFPRDENYSEVNNSSSEDEIIITSEK